MEERTEWRTEEEGREGGRKEERRRGMRRRMTEGKYERGDEYLMLSAEKQPKHTLFVTGWRCQNANLEIPLTESNASVS